MATAKPVKPTKPARQSTLIFTAPYATAFMFGPGGKDVWLRYAIKDGPAVLKWLRETMRTLETEVNQRALLETNRSQSVDIPQSPEVKQVIAKAIYSMEPEVLGKFKLMGEEEGSIYNFRSDCDFKLKGFDVSALQDEEGNKVDCNCTSIMINDKEMVLEPCAIDTLMNTHSWPEISPKDKVRITLSAGCKIIEIFGTKKLTAPSNCIVVRGP